MTQPRCPAGSWEVRPAASTGSTPLPPRAVPASSLRRKETVRPWPVVMLMPPAALASSSRLYRGLKASSWARAKRRRSFSSYSAATSRSKEARNWAWMRA